LAHDVRPATESLGAQGCHECHGRSAPIYFGKVGASETGDTAQMFELRGESETLTRLWAISYEWRDPFKVFIFSALGVLAATLLVYGFGGLAALLRWLGRRA
jgi:hypothetical protein